MATRGDMGKTQTNQQQAGKNTGLIYTQKQSGNEKKEGETAGVIRQDKTREAKLETLTRDKDLQSK